MKGGSGASQFDPQNKLPSKSPALLGLKRLILLMLLNSNINLINQITDL